MKLQIGTEIQGDLQIVDSSKIVDYDRYSYGIAGRNPLFFARVQENNNKKRKTRY
jgi:hypothetical protein